VTNDGGFGMARALGFRFFGSDCDYEHEHELPERVSELLNLVRIEKARDLVLPKIVVAADVCNPLLGEQGATRIFGPQKGAAREQIDVLEKALSRLADVVAKEFGFDHRNEQGAGAGGGLGFGLMTFCGAIMRRGFDVVAETAGLETKMAKADVVITGEGSLDRQTFQGKAPGEVAKMSRRLGKPVFAVAGRAEQNQETQALFDNVYVLTQEGINEHESISRAPELLRERARELAHDL
jgi:glycerate kinase